MEGKTLKITCPICKKSMILTFNTTQCPHCHSTFDTDEVHKVFYDYESKLANSKLYRFGSYMEKSGNAMSGFGGFLQNLGCFIFLLPIGIFCIYILISLLK